MITRRILLCTLTVGVTTLSGSKLSALAASETAAPDAGAASAFVKKLGDDAIRVLRRSDQSLADREAALRDILRGGFALHLIARFSLGRHWRQATQDQQSEYLHVFGEYVLKTYAKRLGGYSGETFEVTGVVPAGKRDLVVATRIRRPSGPPLSAGWRIRSIDGQLKIIDVMVEGVSMALTQRQEFDSVVRARGIAGLVEALRARTDTLSATAG